MSDKLLKRYKEYFNDELSERYAVAMNYEELKQAVNKCIEKNKDYVELLFEKYGDELDL